MKTVPEPSGPNCGAGGVRLDFGIDQNDDGVLSPEEIYETEYVCNVDCPAPLALCDGSCVDLKVSTAHCGRCDNDCTNGVATPGANDRGQLGDGTTTSRAEPVDVPIADGVQVSCGIGHSCVLRESGHAFCWGSKDNDALGGSYANDALVPVEVPNIASGERIATGDSHSCVVFAQGIARCWGFNQFGQLGGANGVELISDFTQVSAGFGHTCGVRQDGTVVCWGLTNNGQGGIVSGALLAPSEVAGLENVQAVALAGNVSCAKRVDGNVVCWGLEGSFKYLGDRASSADRAAIQGLGPVSTISASRDHGCAVELSGDVKCWGNNVFGQLGNGMSMGGSATATAVINLP